MGTAHQPRPTAAGQSYSGAAWKCRGIKIWGGRGGGFERCFGFCGGKSKVMFLCLVFFLSIP